MKNKTKKLHQAITGILLLLFIVGSSIPFLAYAKTDAAVLHANCDDGTIKVYVKGLDSKDDEDEAEELLIGKRECRHLKSYDMEDDEQIVRTLILIANAKTVEVPDRKKTKKVISSIVDNHTDDEQFRLATFGTKLTYFSEFSDDYTSVERLLDTLKFKSKDVHFAQMLSEAMDDLADEGFTGYTRIIVFAPGMNDGADGMAAEQLNDKLDEYRYPIYTFGYEESDNEQALQDMYMLSDMTGAGDCDLTATDDFESILKTLREDYRLQVFEASIPAKSRNGSVKKVKLVLQSGDTLSFLLMMPQEKKETFSPIFVVLAVIVVVFILALVATVSKFSKGKREKSEEKNENDNDTDTQEVKKKEVEKSESDETDIWNNPFPDEEDEDERTQFVSEETVMGIPAEVERSVTLTDTKDNRNVFQSAIRNEVLIGRSHEGADICIAYDRGISRRHCKLILDGEDLLIQDVDAKNSIRVNGKVLEKDQSIPLQNGDIVTLGNTDFRVGL